MTRLIPTRDRAQATRYATIEAAASVVRRIRPLNVGKFWIEPDEEQPKQFLIEIDLAVDALGDFWSGPWYVREVAE